MTRMRTLLAGASVIASLAIATSAQAFCGFYVGAPTSSTTTPPRSCSCASTRTVLSMQNNYEGRPPTSPWWSRCR